MLSRLEISAALIVIILAVLIGWNHGGYMAIGVIVVVASIYLYYRILLK